MGKLLKEGRGVVLGWWGKFATKNHHRPDMGNSYFRREENYREYEM